VTGFLRAGSRAEVRKHQTQLECEFKKKATAQGNEKEMAILLEQRLADADEKLEALAAEFQELQACGKNEGGLQAERKRHG